MKIMTNKPPKPVNAAVEESTVKPETSNIEKAYEALKGSLSGQSPNIEALVANTRNMLAEAGEYAGPDMLVLVFQQVVIALQGVHGISLQHREGEALRQEIREKVADSSLSKESRDLLRFLLQVNTMIKDRPSKEDAIKQIGSFE